MAQKPGDVQTEVLANGERTSLVIVREGRGEERLKREEGEEFLLADELPTIQSNCLSPFAECDLIRGRVPGFRKWWYRRSIWLISTVHPGVAL